MQKKMTDLIHRMNIFLHDHNNLSLKELNEGLAGTLGYGMIASNTPKPPLHELEDFKKLRTLLSDDYPLGKKMKDLAEESATSDSSPQAEAAYKAFREAAYNLEHLGEKYTKERGLLFKSSPQREIAGINEGTERLIEQIQTSLGSRSGATDERERSKHLDRCREQITLINEVIGQIKDRDNLDNEIAGLLEKREKLNKLVTKTLQKTDHKKIRTYSEQGSTVVDLSDKTTEKEKLEKALNALGTAIPSNTTPDSIQALLVHTDKLVKYAKQDADKFRVDPGMDVVIHDEDDINAYHSQVVPNYIDEDHPEPVTLKLNSGVGVIGSKYMGIMNIGKLASLKNADDDYLITDQQLLEFAAKFVLKFHAGLPAEDKGKRLVLSEAVHPRVVLAILTYCELSEEKFPAPRAPASYNADIMAKNTQWRYKSKMEAHLRDPETKKRIKQVEEVDMTAGEKQLREKPTLGDKIGIGLGITPRPKK